MNFPCLLPGRTFDESRMKRLEDNEEEEEEEGEEVDCEVMCPYRTVPRGRFSSRHASAPWRGWSGLERAWRVWRISGDKSVSPSGPTGLDQSPGGPSSADVLASPALGGHHSSPAETPSQWQPRPGDPGRRSLPLTGAAVSSSRFCRYGETGVEFPVFPRKRRAERRRMISFPSTPDLGSEKNLIVVQSCRRHRRRSRPLVSSPPPSLSAPREIGKKK